MPRDVLDLVASKASKDPKVILGTGGLRAHAVVVRLALKDLREFKVPKENVALLVHVLVAQLVPWAQKEKEAGWGSRGPRETLAHLGHKALVVATASKVTRVHQVQWVALDFVVLKVIVVCKVPKVTLVFREPRATRATLEFEVQVAQWAWLDLPAPRELLVNVVLLVLWVVAVSKVRLVHQERWAPVDRRETEGIVVFVAHKVCAAKKETLALVALVVTKESKGRVE